MNLTENTLQHIDYPSERAAQLGCQPTLNRDDTAEFLTEMGFKIAPGTLQKLACNGGGPEYAIWGRNAIYEPPKALEWAKNRRSLPRTNTSASYEHGGR